MRLSSADKRAFTLDANRRGEHVILRISDHAEFMQIRLAPAECRALASLLLTEGDDRTDVVYASATPVEEA